MDDPAKELFERGLERLKRGEMLMALPCFEKSFGLDPSNSLCLSYMALLMGLERGRVKKAIVLAQEAAARTPGNPIVHVNLGKLYKKAGKDSDALEAVRRSLKGGVIPEAEALLKEINPRMRPLFPFLARGHFLNRWAGKILKKTGLRHFRMPGQKDKSEKLLLLARRGL
jgi:tetratricopeptide (TPR) repeat protein